MKKIILALSVAFPGISGTCLAQTQNNMTPGDMVNQPVRTRIEDSLKRVRPGHDTIHNEANNLKPKDGSVITHFEDSAYIGKAPADSPRNKRKKHHNGSGK